MNEDKHGLKSDFMEKLLEGVAVYWKSLGKVAELRRNLLNILSKHLIIVMFSKHLF